MLFFNVNAVGFECVQFVYTESFFVQYVKMISVGECVYGYDVKVFNGVVWLVEVSGDRGVSFLSYAVSVAIHPLSQSLLCFTDIL